MRASSLPLRILLVLALVLNGTGSAMAGVRMALAPLALHAQHQAPAGHAHAADEGHCGGHVAASAAPTEPSACGHSDDHSDCSDGPGCLLACAHAQFAVLPPLPAAFAQPRAGAIRPPPPSQQAPPPLPALIRPPIA